MSLLAGGITHGQAISLILLCVFLIIFIIVDVYLVLFLRRKNKKLAKRTDLISEKDSESDDTNSTADKDEFTEII